VGLVAPHWVGLPRAPSYLALHQSVDLQDGQVLGTQQGFRAQMVQISSVSQEEK